MVADAQFNSLYVDVDYLDAQSLETIYKHACGGFPVCIRNLPLEPGRITSPDYQNILNKLIQLKNVSAVFKDINPAKPLVQSGETIEYQARETQGELMLFFPHPRAYSQELPLDYGFSRTNTTIQKNIVVHYQGKSMSCEL